MPYPVVDSSFTVFRLRRAELEIEIRPLQPGEEEAFRALNEQWIAKYFRIEEKDREVLCDPAGKILNQGGHIFFAIAGSIPIGTCALLAMRQGGYEVAKMAVEEKYRGLGIGRALLEYVLVEARRLGARRLYLETNSALSNAIHLYESMGFRHVDPVQVTPSPYARANVFMEKFL
jgi:putative acetyltransferase